MMQLLQQINSFVTTYAGIVTIAGLLVSIVGAYLAGRQLIITVKRNKSRGQVQRSKFPFDRITVDELLKDPQALGLKLQYADVNYVPRLPAYQHQEMRDEWRNILNRPKHPRLLYQFDVMLPYMGEIGAGSGWKAWREDGYR
jgi:hypothetical protein